MKQLIVLLVLLSTTCFGSEKYFEQDIALEVYKKIDKLLGLKKASFAKWYKDQLDVQEIYDATINKGITREEFFDHYGFKLVDLRNHAAATRAILSHTHDEIKKTTDYIYETYFHSTRNMDHTKIIEDLKLIHDFKLKGLTNYLEEIQETMLEQELSTVPDEMDSVAREKIIEVLSYEAVLENHITGKHYDTPTVRLLGAIFSNAVIFQAPIHLFFNVFAPAVFQDYESTVALSNAVGYGLNGVATILNIVFSSTEIVNPRGYFPYRISSYPAQVKKAKHILKQKVDLDQLRNLLYDSDRKDNVENGILRYKSYHECENLLKKINKTDT